MLVARRARTLVVAELDGAARACAALAETHRGTVLAARTLLQQAVPTTFGLKASTWLVGLLHARRRLLGVRLQAQLGGAGGTLALLGEDGIEVLQAYARSSGSPSPSCRGTRSRGPILELARRARPRRRRGGEDRPRRRAARAGRGRARCARRRAASRRRCRTSGTRSTPSARAPAPGARTRSRAASRASTSTSGRPAPGTRSGSRSASSSRASGGAVAAARATRRGPRGRRGADARQRAGRDHLRGGPGGRARGRTSAPRARSSTARSPRYREELG